ncbi:MAG: hypothetical protein NTX72_00890 [Candidatus Uhrbacteria bacterium]|nr:hypothetical protein [Candidatus Uhrbacteria bacterium]
MRKPVQKLKSFFCLDASAFDVDHDEVEVYRHPKLGHLSPKEATRVHNKLVVRHNGDADEMHHAKLPIIGHYLDENAKDGVYLKPVFKVPHRAKTASWKDASNASKQWARHERRLTQSKTRREVKMNEHRAVYVAKRAHKEEMENVCRFVLAYSEYRDIYKRGRKYSHLAYLMARTDYAEWRLHNEPSPVESSVTMNVTRVRCVEVSTHSRDQNQLDDLRYLQEENEPQNLEDLGHEGFWNPSLPAGFGIVTDESFNHRGELRRVKFVPLADKLHLMECFRPDAYQDEDRDDDTMSELRFQSEQEMRKAA